MRKNKDIRLKVKLTPAGVIWEIVQAILYLFMFLVVASFVFAFVWILINSFKSAPEYLESSFALPDKLDFSNYAEVITKLQFKGYGLFGMLGNSLLIVAWNIFTTIALPSMAAYVLARFDFKVGKIIETVVWISLVIPVVGTSSSTMWFLNSLGLYDTFAGMFIIKTAGLGFVSIMLTNFFRGVSRSYAEAAMIDGASEWNIYMRIYLPQAKAIILINVINNFITTWNDYMQPYLYLPSHPTLALGMQQLQAQFVDFGNDYPVMFAGVLLSMIPIIVLYCKFSKTMINNMAVGTMK